jgi:lipopolysaccharide export system permease protein
MRSLLYDIQRKRPSFQIVEGIFYNGIEGYSMRIDSRDPNTNMLYGIRIYDHTERKGNNMVTVADSGFMRVSADDQYLIFTLYSGHSYNELESDRKNKNNFTYPHRRDLFQEQTILIQLTGFGLDRTDESLFKSNYSMMSLNMLGHYEDSFRTEIHKIYQNVNEVLSQRTYYNYKKFGPRPSQDEPGKDDFVMSRLNLDSLYNELEDRYKIQTLDQALVQARASMNHISTSSTNTEAKVSRLRKFQIEIQRKFTLSFACLIFFFIGAPLGAIIRKGGLGMPTVISVLFFLAWYVLSMSGEQLARDSSLSPVIGMWLSSAILLPIGIWLTYKSMTDSSLMDMETYHLFFRRIKRRIRYVQIKLGKRS